VQEEEAGQAELVDQLQLLLESRARLAAEAVSLRVALLEVAPAHVGELHDRRLGTVREVRVAVAELFGEVELQALGERDRARDCCAVVREALEQVGGREQDAFVVAAPLRLAAVERAAIAHGDEDVLQRRASRMVSVHVAGDERRDAQ
jgi:hypothetical protein